MSLDIKRIFSKVRFFDEEREVNVFRSSFQIDQDRVFFSRPFRRLQDKTQVHPIPENNHVRNRLVHTLEVSSVGRSLAFEAGTKIEAALKKADVTPLDLSAIVQAACLVHDIGNPNFGHAGEEALVQALQKYEGNTQKMYPPDFSRFDGNAQGFRIITKIDEHRFNGGLRLTYPTTASILKYPWNAMDSRSNDGKKFGWFLAEEEQVYRLVRQIYDLQSLDQVPRHPATYLMEAADDICYTIADLEDAVEIGIISLDEFIALMVDISGYRGKVDSLEYRAGQLGYMRSVAISKLVSCTAQIFADRFANLVANPEEVPISLVDCVSDFDQNLSNALKQAQNVNRTRVYFHPRKVSFELAAPQIVGVITETLLNASFELSEKRSASLCSRTTKQALTLFGDYAPNSDLSHEEVIRTAIDAVSGMTDRYATYIAARLRGIQ
jgi:dGTPase